MTSLNPTIRIGTQITERILALNKHISKQQAQVKAKELLEMVMIPDAKIHLDKYPFELSGGMRQRVMFAIARACDPKILILDEPTTGLHFADVAHLLRVLERLRDAGVAVVLTTHDMHEAEALADHVYIVDRGRVTAQGTVAALTVNGSLEDAFLHHTTGDRP